MYVYYLKHINTSSLFAPKKCKDQHWYNEIITVIVFSLLDKGQNICKKSVCFYFAEMVNLSTALSIILYSDDSLIRAPIVRKSR